MARTGSFNLKINDRPNHIDVLSVLDLFQLKGWRINDHGSICYLPLGDEDFEWNFAPISEKETVYDILSDKAKRLEIVGINLISEKTNIGLSVLFYPNFEKISLSAEINRRVIEGCDVTDFTWYLKEFIPVFLKAGLSIEVIECIDS